MDDPVVLRTEHLTRRAGGRTLVSDVSVAVERGQILGVVGPSGSGKTSFLRLLNRLDEPTGGTVYLEGRDYRDIPPRELRRRVGMVTQAAFLFPGTIADNVRFGPAQRGERLSDASVDELCAAVGLPGQAGGGVATLSGGEAQRVSLARALANAPTVLLLDEPTSALDAAAKQGIESLVLAIVAARRLTCVLVTHDLAQAGRLASRTMLLAGGTVQRLGATQEVIRAEAGLR